MKRLTTFKDEEIYLDTDGKDEHEAIWNAIDRLYQYEEADEKGEIINFNTKIGDHIWQILHFDQPHIAELEILSLTVYPENVLVAEVRGNGYITKVPLNFGETVFHSREEAENKLMEIDEPSRYSDNLYVYDN